mmetsp:Transcript_34392/g.86355  ORF Transcript_34392/g.86355 Transcript_34392/m.86355 type:complete len:648 (-) Transcript_34392:2-1945(-)
MKAKHRIQPTVNTLSVASLALLLVLATVLLVVQVCAADDQPADEALADTAVRRTVRGRPPTRPADELERDITEIRARIEQRRARRGRTPHTRTRTRTAGSEQQREEVGNDVVLAYLSDQVDMDVPSEKQSDRLREEPTGDERESDELRGRGVQDHPASDKLQDQGLEDDADSDDELQGRGLEDDTESDDKLQGRGLKDDTESDVELQDEEEGTTTIIRKFMQRKPRRSEEDRMYELFQSSHSSALARLPLDDPPLTLRTTDGREVHPDDIAELTHRYLNLTEFRVHRQRSLELVRRNQGRLMLWHIHKNGGTTMCVAVSKIYFYKPRDNCNERRKHYPALNDMTPEQQLDFAEKSRVPVIGWEYTMPLEPLFGSKLAHVIVFRDPLGRAISHYQHVYRLPWKDHPRKRLQSWTFFNNDENTDNFHVRFITGLPQSFPNPLRRPLQPVTEAHLRIAARHLVQFTMIMDMADLTQSYVDMGHVFGPRWAKIPPKVGTIRKADEEQQAARPTEPTPEQIDEFYRENKYDYILYEFAKRVIPVLREEAMLNSQLHGNTTFPHFPHLEQTMQRLAASRRAVAADRQQQLGTSVSQRGRRRASSVTRRAQQRPRYGRETPQAVVTRINQAMAQRRLAVPPNARGGRGGGAGRG